tara:strand:- start:75 stop:233 length:159 start_codon:yes stop_codon:yes gene_type:complete
MLLLLIMLWDQPDYMLVEVVVDNGVIQEDHLEEVVVVPVVQEIIALLMPLVD